MTATTLHPRVARLPRAAIAVGLLVTWAGWRATTGRTVFNTGGWPSFAAFWSSIVDPATDLEFLRLTADATAITAAYAVLGTALSVVIGFGGGLLVAARPWESVATSTPHRIARTALRGAVRFAFVVPRAVHEVIWALLLVQVLGFDPLVAVLAIGIQFGAVTAKVYGELLDDADPSAFRALRAAGAGRGAAVAYGLVPPVRRDLVSYGFYRLECSVRSAAVLGIVGVGGLGFQLDLSFESLRYDEMWTLIAALLVLSGVADAWSSLVRRSGSPTTVRRSWIALAATIPLSWWYVGLDLGSLWSERTRRLARDLIADLFPPRLGPGGWSELVAASIDTLSMSILAASLATIGGLVLATLAARPHRHDAGPGRRAAGFVTRAALLLLRAVPAPVWAFLVILVMFPGIWPGAVALGLYNVGVLGRLFAEVFEDHDDRARRHLDVAGAPPGSQFWYAVLPMTSRRIGALALYRWEVITRETVVVGVVGAAGLGRLIQEHLVARDLAAVLGAVGALVVLTSVIDGASSLLRRTLP